MEKIITAIGNKKLNEKLKAENTFQVMADDIQYKEGILEILEKEKDINILILSELIPGQIEIKELIEKVKSLNPNIRIILFLEQKNKELENYLYAKGIYDIFYNNQIEFSKIIDVIKNKEKNSTEDMKKEIEYLKKLLEKESQKNKKLNYKEINSENIKENNLMKKQINSFNDREINTLNNNYNQESKIINNDINEQKIILEENSEEIFSKEKNKIKINKKCKIKDLPKEIICVSGTCGVGKSIFCINLAKSLVERKSKILIIDFDILNNSLHTILGIKKYPEKIKNKIKNNNLLNELCVEELIIKINSKIDLISGINLLFDSKYKISSIKVKNILQTLKEKYYTIIIDTSSECFFDYTKEIMKNSNINIFITEANLLEIKKAKRLLNIYINEWEIPQKNFNILFNKYNKNSIDISILQSIFSNFSILGKLSISPQYNLLINKNDKQHLDKNLQDEYAKINKKL